MIFNNSKFQKTVGSLIIISLFVLALVTFTAPKKAEAAFGFGDIVFDIPTEVAVGKSWAEQIVKQILMKAARSLLTRLTQSTINWINSGFHGNPLYIENPKSFFNDIAKTEVKNMVNLFGFDRTHYPYGRAFAQNIIRSYQSQLATNAEYSLSRVITDPALLESYRNDFSTGGWSGFSVNTQYPQNNYIGFNMMATEELARRLEGTHQTAAQKVEAVLQQGQGFLSPQTCPSNPSYNNLKNEFQRPSFQPTIPYNPPQREAYADDDSWGRAMLSYESDYQARVGLEKTGWEQANTCPGGLVSTTPGSIVASHVMTAINSKYRQNELAAAMGNSLAAILDTLMDHFINKGLNALSNAITPEPEGDRCDFAYFGDKIAECGGEGAGNPSGPSCPAYVPDEDVDCTIVDRDTVLEILNKYPMTNEGLTEAVEEIKTIYPQAAVIPHDTGNRILDKIDFGNGMAVDVGVGFGGPNPSWGWGVDCECNRAPGGDIPPAGDDVFAP